MTLYISLNYFVLKYKNESAIKRLCVLMLVFELKIYFDFFVYIMLCSLYISELLLLYISESNFKNFKLNYLNCLEIYFVFLKGPNFVKIMLQDLNTQHHSKPS